MPPPTDEASSESAGHTTVWDSVVAKSSETPTYRASVTSTVTTTNRDIASSDPSTDVVRDGPWVKTVFQVPQP